jgi:hypothetical protein
MDQKLEQLKLLGAGDLPHLNGSLITHLQATESILKSWGASQVLTTAGLFHAVYGTGNANNSMVALSQRTKIADVIGEQAEALVYLYCSCDRDYVFPQFGKSNPIHFKDRFDGSSFALLSEQAKLFCELTAANELELVYTSEQFKKNRGAELLELFRGMDSYLSPKARVAYQSALSEFV